MFLTGLALSIVGAGLVGGQAGKSLAVKLLGGLFLLAGVLMSLTIAFPPTDPVVLIAAALVILISAAQALEASKGIIKVVLALVVIWALFALYGLLNTDNRLGPVFGAVGDSIGAVISQLHEAATGTANEVDTPVSR